MFENDFFEELQDEFPQLKYGVYGGLVFIAIHAVKHLMNALAQLIIAYRKLQQAIYF